MLSTLKSAVTSGWFLTLVGLVLVSALVWFIGPLIEIANVSFLSGVVTRLLVIFALFVVWGLYNLYKAQTEIRKNREFVATLGPQDAKAQAVPAPEKPAAAKSSGESAAVEKRLDDALNTLKTARFGQKGDFLYQLPWYVIIGPPAAGKTTALLKSGLSFPLAEHGTGHAVKGMGGTQRCDWWFTDEAVLIDTAGRYATQDSNQEKDSAEWLGFLDALKKRRPRRPLNGVVVAIAATDLVGGDPEVLERHSRAIRNRIDELNVRLGVRLPVYVMITKTDLLAGFTDFFENLGQDDRAEVWGMTFPYAPDASLTDTLSNFGAESDALARRLSDRLLLRLQEEPDASRRVRIFGFPQQFAALRRQAETFLKSCFEDSRYKTRPILRGLYFTSGTQEGAPIDRLLGALTKGMGAGGTGGAIGRSTAKSFFISRLLKDVIFAEASLAGADPRAERRQNLIHWSAVAAGVGLLAVMSALWTFAYARNSSMLTALEGEVGAITLAAQNTPAQRDAKSATIVPLLNLIRDATFSRLAPKEKRDAGWSFGLGQSRRAGQRLHAVYRKTLESAFLPRILGGLEGRLRASGGDPETVYELLRVYLMAGGQGPMDKDATLAWLAANWETDYPGAGYEPVRADLVTHTRNLISAPYPPEALDESAVSQARASVRTLPRAKLAFSQLLFDPEVRALGLWTLFDHAGPQGPELFAPLTDETGDFGVPSLYTRSGYFDLARGKIKLAAETATSESWVMGVDNGPIASLSDQASLRDEIEQLYFANFVTTWNGYLDAVRILEPACDGGKGAADAACLLSNADRIALATGPASPLKSFLEEAAKATDLTEQSAEGLLDAAAAVNAKAARAKAAADRIPGGGGQSTPIEAVIREFGDLRAFVAAPEGGTSRLDRSLDMLKDYGQKVEAASGEFQDGAAKLAARDAASRLERAASDLPRPARQLFLAFVGSAAAAVSQQSKQQIGQAFATEVAGECASALKGRFPIEPSASENLLLGDFTRLFGPGGVLDAFFTQQLARYAITTTKPWSVTPDGETVGITPGTLRRFQYADQVRKEYFGKGTLGSAYTLQVIALDPQAAAVRFTVDGQTLENAHTQPRAVGFSWPGPLGEQGARIVFDRTDGRQSAKSWTGEWAVFRMLKDAQILSKDAAGITFAISVEGLTARFALQAESVNNPFTSDALQRVSCAGGL